MYIVIYMIIGQVLIKNSSAIPTQKKFTEFHIHVLLSDYVYVGKYHTLQEKMCRVKQLVLRI